MAERRMQSLCGPNPARRSQNRRPFLFFLPSSCRRVFGPPSSTSPTTSARTDPSPEIQATRSSRSEWMTDRQHSGGEKQVGGGPSRPVSRGSRLKPRRGLGPEKKKLVEEAKAQKYAEQNTPASSSKKKIRIDPDEHSAARVKIKHSAHHPKDLFATYLHGVVAHRIGFYQIDALTWCAEIFDPSSPVRYHGVDSWAIVKAKPEYDGTESYSCWHCPDYRHYQDCMHVRVLHSPARPDLEPASKTGMSTSTVD